MCAPWYSFSSVVFKCREGVEAAAQQSGGAAPTKAAQPQVTGPTEISEAATVSDHAHPGVVSFYPAKVPLFPWE